MSQLTPDMIRSQLERLLASDTLSKSAANQRLLGYLVQRSLDGTNGPKELEIAVDVFGRDASFNCAGDSLVRVATRTLRQKLLEYYSGPGKQDQVVFEIPKGAYRLTATARTPDSPADPAAGGTPPDLPADSAPPGSQGKAGNTTRRWFGVAACAILLLLLSVAANVHLWRSMDRDTDPIQDQVRASALWAPIVNSRRPVMFVLGDLFMFTQNDPQTGRLQTVRDTQINSADDLRAFLANNPSLSAERGLRYSSMLQKSVAVSMVQILRIVGSPGRQIEVRLRDELQAEDIRNYDIVYVGPISRLGPLASDYHGQSIYRFDAATATIVNTETGRQYLPEGDLGDHHTEYALVARYPGPVGNCIMILTSGGRNAGLVQVVRMLTSPEGLQNLRPSPGADAASLPESFEALLAVSGYKRTELAASLVELHPLRVKISME
jgi:hypothetical protein